MPRELTKTELQAVRRVERALAAIPDSLALFFHEGGVAVFDRETWNQRPERNGLWVDENESDSFTIGCRYDTGAL